MKRHVKSLLVATLCAVFTWACEQQGPTSPSALATPGGVSLGAAGGVSIGPDGLPIRTARGGRGGGGGKTPAPAVAFDGAMTTTGQPFLLTFFKETETHLTGNSDSKNLVPVTKNFSETNSAGMGQCETDPLDAPSEKASAAFKELVKGSQETFATIINADKFDGGTGTVSLHYHETVSGDLITVKVGASPSFGSPRVTGYKEEEVDGKITITYTITGGAVAVHLREGKKKDLVSLACPNMDPIAVRITKS